MNRSLRRVALTLSGAALIAGGMQAMAQDDFATDEPGSGDMLADLVFVRPLSLVGTVLGPGIFLVALPFTAPSGDVEKTANAFVANPFEYTFNRRLGDFNHCGRARHACGDD